tara:strand:- start:191 stop:391 length:201 start_codon:yes stop_codon:yes gene_type:complete
MIFVEKSEIDMSAIAFTGLINKERKGIVATGRAKPMQPLIIPAIKKRGEKTAIIYKDIRIKDILLG